MLLITPKMTTKTRYTTVRIETDIEKNREEQNWTKVIELAEQLKDRSPNFGKIIMLPNNH